MGDKDYNIFLNNLKTTDILICVWGHKKSLKRNGSVLTTSASGEVDRNHPMTLGNATKVCGGYVRRKSLVKDEGGHISKNDSKKSLGLFNIN